MLCGGCGNKEARHVKIRYNGDARAEQCDVCGKLGYFNLPDAYCPPGGYFDENLADAEHKKGQFVHDKRHKSELLKKLNLVEAGGQRNPQTGKVTPFIKDPERRRRYCVDNFG